MCLTYMSEISYLSKIIYVANYVVGGGLVIDVSFLDSLTMTIDTGNSLILNSSKFKYATIGALLPLLQQFVGR